MSFRQSICISRGLFSVSMLYERLVVSLQYLRYFLDIDA
jgi:hypothetical protein